MYNHFDKDPSCPRPPHNLSYCKDWAERVSDVKFWQSTTTADFRPPKARSAPNLLPCLEGRVYTRTEIGQPTGTALAGLYKVSTSHRDYTAPPGLRDPHPSEEGYRQPWKTVLCRWCGDRRPSGECSQACGRQSAAGDHRLPLYTVIGMYTDSSRENEPGCSPCLADNQLQTVSAANMVPEDRLGPVCPLPGCVPEPARSRGWAESMTRHDFRSPHGPGARAERATKPNYYQRFMDDMCKSLHIMDRVADFGTLGGSVTQYQNDFCQRLPTEDLQNKYRILVGCPPLTGNNVLSPYSTCGKSCDI